MRARIVAAALSGAALVGAALGAPPAVGATVVDLPRLTAAQLLELAGVDAPPAGVALEIHADFPAENPLVLDGVPYTAITASVLPTGGVQMHNAVTASGDGGAAPDECTDNFFTPTGRTWRAEDLPVRWRFRRGTVPSEMNRYRAQAEINDAHQVWRTTVSRCEKEDQIDFRFDFTGRTVKEIDFNGVNTVEFGALDSGALAINYTWYSGTRILEVDLRFNKGDYRWTAKPGVRRAYQVRNVAAHELGHQIGLDDLGDPHGALTMFGRIGKGELAKASLGAGDVRGAKLLTP